MMFDVYPVHPISIARASGSYVYDQQDTKYLDMYGGHAVISLGHTHPHWIARLQEQMHKISFYSNSVKMPIQNELAALLERVSGKESYQLFLVNSGAEANENAIKLASFHTGRKLIISFTKAFHGRTSMAVAATDNPAIVAPVNETRNVRFLPFNDVDALEDFFWQYGSKVAAVITEGIQGVGGIHEASREFLQAIRRLCNKYKALYIADAVQCGYGRTGQFFAHDSGLANADIYTMAKGMGNGYPIGGLLISPTIKAKHGMLGTTFGGNPLACAAALAVLETIEAENLMNNASEQGNYLLNALAALPAIATVRGRGLMIGFEPASGYEHLKNELLTTHKIFTGEAKPNVVRLLPSLALSRQDAQWFVNTVSSIKPQ